jgi:hypothetical protein
MGGIFFAEDKIQSILSGRYLFTDCNTAGPVCSLCVYRAHTCMRFLGHAGLAQGKNQMIANSPGGMIWQNSE